MNPGASLLRIGKDWSPAAWTPKDRGVLLFILHEGKVMLIQKKRGLGAGKINGPGGRIDPGETAEQAAVRETREEIGLETADIEKSGELFFAFADGYSLHCTVFRTFRFSGEPIETPEAVPMWVPLPEVPYAKMWQDDIFWFPHMVEGRPFRGFFTFEDDRMLDKEIELL